MGDLTAKMDPWSVLKEEFVWEENLPPIRVPDMDLPMHNIEQPLKQVKPG